MSDYYWNEYIKYFGDDTDLKRSLKLSEILNNRLVTKTNLYEGEKIVLLRLNRTVCSDVGIKFYDIDKKEKDIYLLFMNLKRAYSNLNIKTSFPILVNGKERGEYIPGVYSFDFEEDKLILLDDRIIKNIEKTDDLIVSFFLNIDLCIALDGMRGFVYGIEEIGKIIGDISRRLLLTPFRCNIPRKTFTHDLGLNVRKVILIDIFGVGVR